MGYNIDISINTLKLTNFSEMDNTIQHIAELYKCESIYSISEEDGTIKIPVHKHIYTVSFCDKEFDNLLKFIRYIKKYKNSFIETIYNTHINKLIYASSSYLNTINKDECLYYKKFIKEYNFTMNEIKLINELH